MKLGRTVLLLGLTSLLTDVGSEMIFPLLPLFLTVELGASTTFLGLLEGAADAVAAVLKLVSGGWSDRTGRRKPWVVAGYGLAGVVRPLVGLAGAPWQVLSVRLTDRVGKGIRSAPRDALIADSVPAELAGRAFGFHKAMDHAGAVLGPLIASAMLYAGVPLRSVFLWTALPGLLAFLAVSLVREEPRPTPAPGAQTGGPLPLNLRRLLGVLLVFGLGNSSDAFLLLRAGERGLDTALIPLLWALLHVSKMGWALIGGRLADRYDRVTLIIAGWAVFVASYAAMAALPSPGHVWWIFPLYGAFYGLAEPAEKALVRDLVPAADRGRAFGWYNLVTSGSALPAGLLFGALWDQAGPVVALSTGAGLALAAMAALATWRRAGASRP